MALRLRRGTNAERLTIIPQEGELIYTTDTKELYAGDGSTIGGLRVTGSTEGSPAALSQNLDLASNNITGIGSIDITGTVTANFDGDVIGNVLGDVRGSVFGDDSTLIVDAVNNKLTGDLTGDVLGEDGTLLVDSFNNIVTSNVIGDVQGSVFGDDSTVLVDAVNNTLSASALAGTANLNKLNIQDSTDVSLDMQLVSDGDLSGYVGKISEIIFKTNGSNGQLSYGIIQTYNNGIILAANDNGATFPASTLNTFTKNGVAIGGINPQCKLDVRGAIKPGVYTDATARDADITLPVAGMMVFNTGLQKFQGYVDDTGLAGGGASNATPGWIALN
jgi:hypothetical protein